MLLEPDHLELMLSKLGHWTGSDALQAVYQVPQVSQATCEAMVTDRDAGVAHACIVAIEEYGQPFLLDKDRDVRVVKGWRASHPEVLRALRDSFSRAQ